MSATSEELAASMEEVSASLHDLAQGCNNLLEKMAGMNEDAKNSAMKLHEVKLTAENSYKEAIASKEKTVETFDGIQKDVAEAVEASKSVNEIAKLTENILNIAAQTNLLALNASIEAARAGEAGKGFAVVADQVSVLAAQSAEAAKESASLIQTSVEAIEKGMFMAHDTAQQLQSVANGADAVVGMVNGMADELKQQAEAIRNINNRVAEINDVVQTNSATSQECAAASQQMSEQAVSLEKLICLSLIHI